LISKTFEHAKIIEIYPTFKNISIELMHMPYSSPIRAMQTRFHRGSSIRRKTAEHFGNFAWIG
jgi:hypothetical protein